MEQIIDLCNYLRYLGVLIEEKTYVFGDNAAMIDGARLPFSKLHKQNHILTYHSVRSVIATEIINLSHLSSKENPSNICSKHWRYNAVTPLLNVIFDTIGDTFCRTMLDLGD